MYPKYIRVKNIIELFVKSVLRKRLLIIIMKIKKLIIEKDEKTIQLINGNKEPFINLNKNGKKAVFKVNIYL